MSLHRLIQLFARHRDSQRPLVLCTVFRTAGSTYAKPGAQMLIAADGEYAGLLSGGCLEGDLRDHARRVAAEGEAHIVRYDMRTPDDRLFGLGAGCEGAMDILLSRVSAAEGWQPLAFMADCSRESRACRMGFVITSSNPRYRRGQVVVHEDPDLLPIIQETPNSSLVTVPSAGMELFVAVIPPPPRLLLAGGGPDARPVAQLAEFLGWQVTVADHRSSYLEAGLFPAQVRLVEARPADLPALLSLNEFSAAVIMSHHLDSDLQHLRNLAHSTVPYVGLLGPAARREKLLADLGVDAAKLSSRLRAPVGLDLGGRSPEAIALSIIGEVHAALAGRGGRPFSEVTA